MAYTKQTWADLPSKTTPINAERLTHIEDGIYSAAQTADTAASTAGTAAANVGIVSGRVETLTGRVNGLDTAVSNKVDKVAGKGLSTNDYDDTDKGKVDSLGTASTKNSTSVVTQSTDLVESGAVCRAIGIDFKNLYNSHATSETAQGVTWTVNPDKTITVSGTPTGFKAFVTYSESLPVGLYKLYGISDTVNVAFNGINFFKDTTLVRTISGSSLGEGVEFEVLESDVSAEYNRLEITYKRVNNGTACSGTIRTMITNANITDTAYEPYHASIEESKCDNSVIGTVEDGTNPTRAYAVGEHMIRGGKFCTVTVVVTTSSTWTLGSNYVEGTIADNLVKQDTFSGNTSANGILSPLYNGVDRAILGVKPDTSAVIVLPYRSGDGTTTNALVLSTNAEPVRAIAVSGTYYYI